MNPAIRPILDELKAGLEALYGDRLDRVILYGSQARGDAGPDSDIDVLVVLRGHVDHARERPRVVHITAMLELKHGRIISPILREAGDIDPRRLFFENLLRDGVPV